MYVYNRKCVSGVFKESIQPTKINHLFRVSRLSFLILVGQLSPHKCLDNSITEEQQPFYNYILCFLNDSSLLIFFFLFCLVLTFGSDLCILYLPLNSFSLGLQH